MSEVHAINTSGYFFGGSDEQHHFHPPLRNRNSSWQVVSCEAVVLVLVGLPARGKSFICGAVVRPGTETSLQTGDVGKGKSLPKLDLIKCIPVASERPIRWLEHLPFFPGEYHQTTGFSMQRC